jgi:hypothetical protein
VPGVEGAGSLIRAARPKKGQASTRGIGAGDRDRTGDIQLGKLTVNCKQKRSRFCGSVLAMKNMGNFANFFPDSLNGVQKVFTLFV